jgi:hypothetical protein
VNLPFTCITEDNEKIMESRDREFYLVARILLLSSVLWLLGMLLLLLRILLLMLLLLSILILLLLMLRRARVRVDAVGGSSVRVATPVTLLRQQHTSNTLVDRFQLSQVDLQIRVWSPALGAFKGVMSDKPGIDKIQLPASTRKIGPSRTASSGDEHVCLIVAGAGCHPTGTNIHVGNILSGAKEPPKSFLPMKLGDMLKILWKIGPRF